MKIFIRYIFLFIFVFQSKAQLADFKAVNFNKADRIAMEYKDEKLTNLPALAHKLTANLETDVERFRAIFIWVCSNVANDYHMYAKNMRKRRKYQNDSLQLAAWNDEFKKVIFKKLRRSNKTICTGYAYIIKELANLANIDCEIVHGFARTSTIDPEKLTAPNHSWNAVKLNNKWYLCDPTWASGIPNPKTAQFQFKFNDGFFLSDPKIFAVNHFPLDDQWFLLEKEHPTFQMFLDAPIVYNDAYSYFSDHTTPEKLHNTVEKNETITFQMQLQKTIQEKDIILIVENSFGEKKRKPDTISIQDQILTITYAFPSTGYYDVHLYIKKDLITTYTFEVEKIKTK